MSDNELGAHSIRSLAEALCAETYADVMVLSTARFHGRGARRLPDRTDRGRQVGAIQVETDEQAQELLSTMDADGRRFHLDVERKQDLDLMRVARTAVVQGRYFPIKPNDITVDALLAVLGARLGPDLSDVAVAINGSGNLAFKFALRLAENGAQVSMRGRDGAKVETMVDALNVVLPRYTPHRVVSGFPRVRAQVLVAAVTAEHIITTEWLSHLARSALCLDVGINNLAPDFIAAAQDAGHLCARLDVRSAGDPLPVHRNPFFTEIAGRRELAGVEIVAGGEIGRLGDVVVDRVVGPSTVIGVANGTGGLLSELELTAAIARRVAAVAAAIDNL